MDRLLDFAVDGGDPKFADFMRKVDAHVKALAGVSVMDLADFCFRDAFDDGVSPKSAAKAALANDGF